MSLTSRFANPGKFMRLAERLMPLFGAAALASFATGLYLALAASPPDYQQGETVRIMYIHVPAAWTGLMLYVAMASAAGVGLVARHALADIFCVAAAPVGAVLVGNLSYHRQHLGQADMGRMVGVGRATDQRADFVFALLRLHRPTSVIR